MDKETGMLTEQSGMNRENLDTSSVEEIIELMNKEDMTVAETVNRALPDITAAVEAIVRVMEKGGRLFYMGAGTSGRLGILDASECPPTFGVDEELVQGMIAGGATAIQSAIENAEDDEEAGRLEVIEKVTSHDAVVGIAASGRTPYVIGGIKAANHLGALTVGISCNSSAPLSAYSRHPIEVPVGPEVVTGSTRLKAGTAQKMVLNMISTTAMIKLGKVYGSLMVNVQATNQKLRERVVRIVMDATDVDEKQARLMTKAAHGDARIAILMIQYRISYDAARAALDQSNGHFRKAMASLEGKAE